MTTHHELLARAIEALRSLCEVREEQIVAGQAATLIMRVPLKHIQDGTAVIREFDNLPPAVTPQNTNPVV